MTKLEKIFAAIITLSLILKFNLLPYGGILLLLSLSALAFYYFLFGKAIFNGIRLKKALRKDSYKEIRDSIIAISKAAGLGLSVICMGILFKLNHWAYSSVIFIAGLSTTFLVTIIAYRGWKKYKNKTYRRIVGRTATIGLIGLIITIIPELVTTKKESRYYKDQINHSIFQYKLLDGKLVDTLKVFNEYKDLVLFQEWENGRLKKTFVVDEFGIKRELVFYSRQDSNGTTQYYYDISDRNYTTFPFNEEMFDFYEKRSFLSSTSVFHDRVNELVLFNYPVKHVGLAVTKGKIILGNENFLVKPNAQKGDTMEVLLHHPLKGKFIKKFDLIVK